MPNSSTPSIGPPIVVSVAYIASLNLVNQTKLNSTVNTINTTASIANNEITAIKIVNQNQNASILAIQGIDALQTLNIASNTSDISNNTTAIGVIQDINNVQSNNLTNNTNSITAIQNTAATQSINIASNTSNLSNLTTITNTNTNNISSNTTNIGSNTTAIVDIQSINATQTTNIGDNSTNIASNTIAIGQLRLIDNIQTANISTNNSNILIANTNITNNTNSITSIQNVDALQTSNISTNTNNLASLTTIINTNTSHIASNTTSINNLSSGGTNNSTAISDNTNAISVINNTLTGFKSTFLSDNIDSSSGPSISVGSGNNTTTMNVANGSGITTVNIANNVSPGACTINIGGPGDTINFGGSVTKLNSTIIESKDTTFTLNNGGTLGSSSMAGIYIEESGSNANSYMRVSGDRTGIELKGVAGGNMLINQSLSNTDNVVFNTITGSLIGSSTNFTGSLNGDITGTQTTTVVKSVGGSLASVIHSGELLANAATPLPTSNALVKRDVNGGSSFAKISCSSLFLNTGSQVDGALLAYQAAGNGTQYIVPGAINITGDVTGTLSTSKITSIGQSVNVNGILTSSALNTKSLVFQNNTNTQKQIVLLDNRPGTSLPTDFDFYGIGVDLSGNVKYNNAFINGTHNFYYSSSATSQKLLLNINSSGIIQIPGTLISGNITTPSISTQAVNSNTGELVLSQTGDQYGGTSLSLRNRGGCNGPLFTNTSTNVDLIDFAMNTATTPITGLFRSERRQGSMINALNTNVLGGEIQIYANNTTTPGLYTGVNQSGSTNTFNVPSLKSTTINNTGLMIPGTIINFVNPINNKIIALYDQNSTLALLSDVTRTDYYGFGISAGILRYQVPNGAQHTFFTSTGANTSISLASINASGINSNGTYQQSGAIVLDSTNGNSNTFIGMQSGNQGGYTGAFNTATGQASLQAISGGQQNSAYGQGSLRTVTGGNNNCSIGCNSLASDTTGSNNCGFGQNSGLSISTGSQNICIGTSAGSNIVDQNNNICIGFGSNVGDRTVSNSIAIGANAVANGSNQIVLGAFGGVQQVISNATIVVNGHLTTTAYVSSQSYITAQSYITSQSYIAAQSYISSQSYITANGSVSCNALIGSTTFTGYGFTGFGAGRGAVVNSVTGSSIAFTVTFTTGTAPAASATAYFFSFSTPYINAPTIIMTPANQFTAVMPIASECWTTSTTTDFQINTNTTALNASTTYAWHILICG